MTPDLIVGAVVLAGLAIAGVLFYVLERRARRRLVVTFSIDLKPFEEAMRRLGESAVRAHALIGSADFQAQLRKVNEALADDRSAFGLPVIVDEAVGDDVYLVDLEAARRPPEELEL